MFIFLDNWCGATIKEATRSYHPYKDIRIRKYHNGKYSESKSLQIQSKHWKDECQISMEGVYLDYFNSYNIGIYYNPKSVF